MKCMVMYCKNNKRRRGPGISFHRFPKNKILEQMWLQAIGQPHFKPNSNNFICSEHFLAKDIFTCDKLNKLSIDAIPQLKLDASSNNFNADLVQSKQAEGSQSKPIIGVVNDSNAHHYVELDTKNFEDCLEFSSAQESDENLSNNGDIETASRYDLNQKGFLDNIYYSCPGREVVLQDENNRMIIVQPNEIQENQGQVLDSLKKEKNETIIIENVGENVEISMRFLEADQTRRETNHNKDKCTKVGCKSKILSLQKRIEKKNKTIKQLKEALRRRDKKIEKLNYAMGDIIRKKFN